MTDPNPCSISISRSHHNMISRLASKAGLTKGKTIEALLQVFDSYSEDQLLQLVQGNTLSTPITDTLQYRLDRMEERIYLLELKDTTASQL